MSKQFRISPGSAHPYGTKWHPEGTNFAVFSKHALHVSLCLFLPDTYEPCCEIPLDPYAHKSGDVWHIYVHDLAPNYSYGYRVDGPFNPAMGHRFDNRFILLDPFAVQVASSTTWGTRHSYLFPGIVHPIKPFDWEGDARPRIPSRELIIYEMHVRGFTQDPSSQVEHRGQFLGLIEKIPYLKALGVNAVELMPIHEFNETENLLHNPETDEQLYNYWGYSTVNFFAPMRRYGSIEDFKTLVKKLHANGIEVILDVVYNHTGEGGATGPTFSFKGLENSTYYMLGPKGEYQNFTGCGNTMNCNNPVVRNLILHSLRYWVSEMHVDGFRFDLASILTREQDGAPVANPPLIEAITQDPILAETKLIAEAWDAAGLYQVGSFPGQDVWAEWNGRYRDDVRSFIKGTDGTIGNFATRLSGSEDLYGKTRLPSNSINFVTSHDGFSLADLVSYNEKHNLPNGENNRDGENNNLSWNCGVEGVTDNPDVLELRLRQRKNFHVALMVSQGIPMIVMGDEYGHTKHGNNNTWAHDSRLNWFQWDTLEQEQDFFRFYSMMIALRKNHPVLTRSRFLGPKDITWHGVEPGRVDWGQKDRFLAFTLPDLLNQYTLYIAFNTSQEPITVHLPWRDEPWKCLVNTSLPSPQDIVSEDDAQPHTNKTFTLDHHSALILKSRDK